MLKKSMKRRGARKPRRSYRPRARYGGGGVKYMAETFYAGTIDSNSGGLFTCKFLDLPQANSYSALYQEFCIKKMTIKLLPFVGQSDPNAVAQNVITGTTPALFNTRILTSLVDSPEQVPPVSELDVMTDDRVKITLNRGQVITLTCQPKPSLTEYSPTLNKFIGIRQRTPQWLNTDNTQVQNPGTNVLHHGLRYWITTPTAPSGLVGAVYDVYIRVKFALRNPA